MPQGTKPKVGFLWSDDAASGQLNDIIGLAADERFDCYSFQSPVFAADRDSLREHGVTDLEPELGDFDKTAARLQQMDVFVGVPSATTHLAGALGVPTKLLLSDHADWRWACTGNHSTWYPAVEVLRRGDGEPWSTALGRCARSLHRRA